MNSTISIDRLTEHDLVLLSALYKQFWGDSSNSEKMTETFRRLQDNPNYILLGAKWNDTLVGSAMGIVCEELYGECKPFMVIEDVIVDDNHRRGGVGSKLMNHLERISVERGCSYILFVTDTRRTEALRFYESLGYELDKHKGFKKRI